MRDFVEGRGMSFAYRQFGVRDELPVLLLHGLGENADTWRSVTAALPDRWTIALDQRGHGRSPWTDDYQLPDMADDVAGVLDALDVPRADIVAHSMGAIVAYHFAWRYAERVHRLVLEEPGPPEPQVPPRDEGERPAGDLGYDWAFQAPFSRQRNKPDPSWAKHLADITAPTLIMTGDDSHIPVAGVHRMAARIPSCRCVAFPTGHEIHSTLPDEFTRVLIGFLGRVRE